MGAGLIVTSWEVTKRDETVTQSEPRKYMEFVVSFTLGPTYFLTPCSTVLLEKLTGSQPFKKFPTFYGTRRFITAFTSACHLSLS